MRTPLVVRRAAARTNLLLLGALTIALSIGCSSDENEGTVDQSDNGVGQTTGGVDPIDATSSDDVLATGDATAQPDVADDDTAVEDAGSPAPSEIVTVEFAAVLTDANAGGASQTLSIEVPQGATSMSISVIGPSGMIALVNSLSSPSGVAMVTPNWFQSPFNQGGTQLCLSCALRLSPQESASGTLVPNSPELTFEAGTWTMTVAAITVKQPDNPFGGAPTVTLESAELDVVVAFQTRSEVDAAVLDLNLFFTGSDNLTAEGGPTDQRLIDALEKMSTIYASQDITIGEVRYFDLSHTGLDKITTMTGADNDFEALARETADAPPGVNVVFVESITDESNILTMFGLILGVSGGIPGPSGIQGTGRSVVAVTLESNPSNPQVTFGNTMAHEVGHYLGLYHSSEAQILPGQPAIHDVIADTPEFDDSNLMHNSGAGGNLTAGQAFVIKSNPWVRPAAQE